jgi:hypothetical protein
VVPIAAFLTGALLSLLLPTALLIALAFWYFVYSAREPDAHEKEPGSAPPAPDPAAFPPEPNQPTPGA